MSFRHLFDRCSRLGLALLGAVLISACATGAGSPSLKAGRYTGADGLWLQCAGASACLLYMDETRTTLPNVALETRWQPLPVNAMPHVQALAARVVQQQGRLAADHTMPAADLPAMQALAAPGAAQHCLVEGNNGLLAVCPVHSPGGDTVVLIITPPCDGPRCGPAPFVLRKAN